MVNILHILSHLILLTISESVVVVPILHRKLGQKSSPQSGCSATKTHVCPQLTVLTYCLILAMAISFHPSIQTMNLLPLELIAISEESLSSNDIQCALKVYFRKN